jgi:di/tripeptidase
MKPIVAIFSELCKFQKTSYPTQQTVKIISFQAFMVTEISEVFLADQP